MEQAVFTFAVGNKYLKLAFTLARSYRFHNDISSCPFYILSTTDFKLPGDLGWVKKSIQHPDFTGTGLMFKLRLSEIAPARDSIFIDADSVVYGDISHLFNTLSRQPLNVIGTNITEGYWVDEDIAACCAEFKLSKMIRYCGALYLLRKSDITKAVFKEAMRLNRSERGFQKHRHNINEEPLISISLSMLNYEPLADDGNNWADLHQLRFRQKTSVFRGITLMNHKNYKYKFWLPEGHYRPRIVHMGSGLLNKAPWIFEYLRLKAFYQLRLPVPVIELVTDTIITPGYYFMATALKNLKFIYPFNAADQTEISKRA